MATPRSIAPHRAARLPMLAIALVVATATVIDLDMKLWNRSDRVIEHDVRGYYGFLPLLFIYDDIRLEEDYYQTDGSYLFWPNTTPDGRRFIKYPVGTAFLYAPFFFIAHGIAEISGHPASGFSAPYKVALLVCALFYLAWGLLLVRGILERLGFSAWATAIVLLLIGAGTNLLCYASQSGGMPHVHGFFLFAAFAALTVRWYERPTWRTTLLLGLVSGLISLVRPTNAVVGLFFLIYGIDGMTGLRMRALELGRSWRKLAVMMAIAIVVWIPQFVYWRIATGHWIYYSYQEEGFFFTHPHILGGLFSYRKGWLLYTPVMVFALAGVGLSGGRAADWRWPVAVTLAVHIWITFSWWCWWYGGTFGQRAMIETYALLAVPLCAFVERVRTWHLGWRIALPVLAGFLIWLNVFQTYQFEWKVLHHDGMSARLYWSHFGRSCQRAAFDAMVDHPDYDRARTTGR